MITVIQMKDKRTKFMLVSALRLFSFIRFFQVFDSVISVYYTVNVVVMAYCTNFIGLI